MQKYYVTFIKEITEQLNIDHALSYTEMFNLPKEVHHPTPVYQRSTIQKTHEHTTNSTILRKVVEMFHTINRIHTLITNSTATIDNNFDRIKELYYTFHIPKASGGLREINAPIPVWSETLKSVKEELEKLKVLEHNSAYAYVKQRSTKDAVEKHQENESKWFLKVDIEKFFPSCTVETMYDLITKVYPFNFIKYSEYLPEESRAEDAEEKFKYILKWLTLDNGLPQGTQTSPILSNLIMVPIDYAIERYLTRFENNFFIYTRYADDIIISSKSNFNKDSVVEKLKEILTPYFQLNTEKTRYGSANGRNWNLGLMLNKDNNITLGYRRKKVLNAMLNNFLRDPNAFTRGEIYSIQGEMSYLQHIEPDYFKYILEKYETKYSRNYRQILKDKL